MRERVVITGMGLSTTLGRGVEANWRSLSSSLAGAAVRGDSKGLPRAIQLADETVSEALATAGLSVCGLDPERIGSTISASKPLFQCPSPTPLPLGEGKGEGQMFVHPPEALNSHLQQRFGFAGEARNVIAACATGVYSIAMAASWLEQGLCDVVLAGSIEPAPHPLIQAGFHQMGVTSADGVTRPFDKNRSGFSFGEGAGIVVLETESHARDRGAAALAVLSGRALGADSHSAFAFNSGGGKISGVIQQALASAGLSPRDLRHVNAHGTGTRHNDWIETQALLKAFGDHASSLMISATKASTGHLLGASGSVEFIFTLLALLKQYVPPTATLETPDPECGLDYTPKQGHSADLRHAMSLSFGFGGPIGALVVSRS